VILSNSEIVRCLRAKKFSIGGLANSTDPTAAPFNTSAVDLRLGTEINVPKADQPVAIDLSEKRGIAGLLRERSDVLQISKVQPYKLKPNTFILANTLETVDFPLCAADCDKSFAARVEGKSSHARCGLLVHFTAPTIHAGFAGTITLEMINLGPFDILLTPEMYICQLIIEEVTGFATDAPNQFKGQSAPAGV
jgi:dCTP deaminase